jgi:hypothetical protein
VIRSGETIDTLFCLGSDCDNEHRQLCEDIVNGDKADDEKLWRNVLEVASDSMSQGKAAVSGTYSHNSFILCALNHYLASWM